MGANFLYRSAHKQNDGETEEVIIVYVCFVLSLKIANTKVGYWTAYYDIILDTFKLEQRCKNILCTMKYNLVI